MSKVAYSCPNCPKDPNKTFPTVRDPPISPTMAIHQPQLCPDDPDDPDISHIMAIHQSALCPEDPDSPGSSCQSHHGNTPARTASGGSRQSGILLSVPLWQYTSQHCVRRIPTVRDPPVSPIMAIHQPELCSEDPDSPGSSCRSQHPDSPRSSCQSRMASDDGTVFAEDPERDSLQICIYICHEMYYMQTHINN